MKKKIMIEGMSCGHCKAHVEEALTPLAKGSVEVSLEGQYAMIETDADEETLIAAIDEAGYDVTQVEEV